MSLENFLTYTEVDPNSRITVAQNTVSWADLSMNEDAYVYKDFTAGHFGDFEHLVEILMSSASGAAAWAANWVLGNRIDDMTILRGAAESLEVSWYGTTLYFYDSGTGQVGSVALSQDTPYYLTIKRAGTTATCKIYSDAARTTLLTTLTITCATTTYRYLYVCNTYNSGTLPSDHDGYTQNLNIQEAVAFMRPMRYW